MINWSDLRYLLDGNACQQRAYTILQTSRLWSTLAAFDPVLAGTIPLAIDTPASDLDVLCEVPLTSQPHFCQLLTNHYSHLPGFRLAQYPIAGIESVVSSFEVEGTEIEVFGQAIASTQQLGFRHLLVEYAVLQAGGESWRLAVQQLKLQGLKTEPAFAQLLQLPGNPYEALLTLEELSPVALRAYLASHPLPVH